MRRTPPNLFAELIANPTTDFTSQEASTFFGSYLSHFSDLGLLVPGVPRNWTHCMSCGQDHELTDIGGVYWLVCPEDDVEAVAVNADQLKTIRFSQQKFYSWLQGQFSLQGNIDASDADGKAFLGQTTVNGKQRLFIFSHVNSLPTREKLCLDHLTSQPVILYLSTELDNHNQGYDINLVDYLTLQANGLSIDVSSALSVIVDTIPPLAGGLQTPSRGYAIELKLQDNLVVVTGTALGGSTPAFRSKRSSTMSKLVKTLLDLNKDSKETVFQTYTKNVLEGHLVDLSSFSLNQNKRSLTNLCSLLLPYFLSHRQHKDGDIFEFKSAISQEDWNKLSDSEKQKILASKAV